MPNITVQDCIEGMIALEDSSIDICVTSPPYNLDIKYGTYADNQPREEYLAWLSRVFAQIARLLKDDGHFFLNVGYSNVDPWVGMDVANEARKHLVLQNNFTWVKSIAIEDKQIGHYKPINSDRFANPTWEHLFHFTKTGKVLCAKTAIGVPYADKNNLNKTGRYRGRLIKRMGFKDKRAFDALATPLQEQELEQALARKLAQKKPTEDLHCPGNAWYVPYTTIADRGAHRGSHPATFPIELVRRAIKFSGATGTLLDPFMGTGTSALAAKLEGLDWIGFDLDPQYVAYAESRLTFGEEPNSKGELDRTKA